MGGRIRSFADVFAVNSQLPRGMAVPVPSKSIGNIGTRQQEPLACDFISFKPGNNSRPSINIGHIIGGY